MLNAGHRVWPGPPQVVRKVLSLGDPLNATLVSCSTRRWDPYIPWSESPQLVAHFQQRPLLLWQVGLSQALLPCKLGWICGNYAGYENH